MTPNPEDKETETIDIDPRERFDRFLDISERLLQEEERVIVVEEEGETDYDEDE